MTTYIIKRGGIWQGGKLRTSDHADTKLRTVELDDEQRKLIDPDGSLLQSAEEAALEAKKLKAEADLSAKRAEALAKIDADHQAELEAKSKPDAKKGGGK